MIKRRKAGSEREGRNDKGKREEMAELGRAGERAPGPLSLGEVICVRGSFS